MTNLPNPYVINYNKLFAEDSSAATSTIEQTSDNAINFKTGIPAVFSQDPASGGKYLERGMLNAIGKMASAAPFYGQIGGVYTFDTTVSNAISGYPIGAILRYTKPDGDSSLVVNLKPNNTNNFVTNPNFIDGKSSVGGWKYISSSGSFAGFPDFSKKKTLFTFSTGTFTPGTNISNVVSPNEDFYVFLDIVLDYSTMSGYCDIDLCVKVGGNWEIVSTAYWSSPKAAHLIANTLFKAGSEIAVRMTTGSSIAISNVQTGTGSTNFYVPLY